MNQITTKSDSSVDIIRDRLVEDIFNLEIKLNSPVVQDKLLKNAKTKDEKIDIIESVLDLSMVRRKLENAMLETIAKRLKRLEPQIQEGIDSLNDAIDNLENSTNILSLINSLTGLRKTMVAVTLN